jgi:uroporphyrinogen decarboxylase
MLAVIHRQVPDRIPTDIWAVPEVRRKLQARFGEQLVFHGGIDNQQTLPFGAEQDVRAEVRPAIDTLASDRTGYILAPCHNIQANTPIENIVAMYDEAHHSGRL